MKKVVSWIVCVLAAVVTHAQITPVANSSKEQILIGESVQLTFELKAIEKNAAVQWKFPDSVLHFEFVKFDTADLFKKTITITSWDSGAWNFEGIRVTVPSTVNGKPTVLAFPPVTVNVMYDTTGSAVLNDIKPIIEISNIGEDWIAYTIIGIAVLSLFLIIYIFRKWKQKQPSAFVFEPVAGAYEEFEKALMQLKQKNRSSQQEQKELFTQLSFIIKRYAERTFRQSYTAYTTDETAIHLSPVAGRDETNTLIQVLRLSDAVKFAKFTVPEHDCTAAFNSVETAIKHIHQQMNA